MTKEKIVCVSTEKTEEMCNDCKLNIDLSEIGNYYTFTEFDFKKVYKDGEFKKECKGKLCK
jgi:hypothetical protein